MLEPDGPEHRRYVERLVGALEGLRMEGEAALVRDVRCSKDDYPGPRSAHLPDAIVRWAGAAPVSKVRSAALGELVAEPGTGRGGNHRFEGFCVIIDERGTRTSPGDGPANIADLAGTAAGLLE